MNKNYYQDGIKGYAEEPDFNRHWYEDVEFIILPKEGTVVERDEKVGRTTWVQGLEGWYVDEKTTQV